MPVLCKTSGELAVCICKLIFSQRPKETPLKISEALSLGGCLPPITLLNAIHLSRAKLHVCLLSSATSVFHLGFTPCAVVWKEPAWLRARQL